MLPSISRMRSAEDFAAVVKGGRRGGTRRLVVHLLPTGRQVAPRAGFVVSGKVGNSVVRHRITRRLRPLVRDQLGLLDLGTDLVIRALPAAATATSAELGTDLRNGLAAAVRKGAVSAHHGTGRPERGVGSAQQQMARSEPEQEVQS